MLALRSVIPSVPKSLGLSWTMYKSVHCEKSELKKTVFLTYFQTFLKFYTPLSHPWLDSWSHLSLTFIWDQNLFHFSLFCRNSCFTSQSSCLLYNLSKFCLFYYSQVYRYIELQVKSTDNIFVTNKSRLFFFINHVNLLVITIFCVPKLCNWKGEWTSS